MNIIISGDLLIVSESATDTVFIHLQKKVGDKAKSLTGMFKWECSSLDFAIKENEAPTAIPVSVLGQTIWRKAWNSWWDSSNRDARYGNGELWWKGEAPAVMWLKESCERSCALCRCGKSPHKGQAVNFITGRNGMWHQGHLCELSKRLWAERFQSIGIDACHKKGYDKCVWEWSGFTLSSWGPWW